MTVGSTFCVTKGQKRERCAKLNYFRVAVTFGGGGYFWNSTVIVRILKKGRQKKTYFILK